MRHGIRRSRRWRLAVLSLPVVCACSAPAGRIEPAAATAAEGAPPATRRPAPSRPGPPAAASAAAAPEPASAAAVERALALALPSLEREGGAWMRGETPLNRDNGCISCHVVGFTLWSHNAAAERGVAVDAAALDRLTAEAMEFTARPRVGRPVTWSQLLLGRPRDAAAGADWRSMVDGTLASQERAGQWRARGQFPTQRRPVAESDAVATMWSLLALASIAEAEPADPAALERALAWLEASAAGVSSEWLAMRLLTARRYGKPAAAEALLARLLAEQRPDGGWSWLLAASPGGEADPSNAYSTGVALFTLRRAGLASAHPAVAAGVAHLLATQRPDGTWEVPSRLISAEPGEAKDWVYDYWGTAWAAIGLAGALEPRA